MGVPISSGNRGVLALGSSLVGLCAKAAPNAEIAYLIGHNNSDPVTVKVNGEERTIKVVNCRLSPKSKLENHLVWILFMSLLYRTVPINRLRNKIARSNAWIGQIQDSTIVGDVRGGDSFSDIYGMGRFIYGFLLALSVILIRGNITHFPQTYGPYKSRISRWLSAYLLKHSSSIIARDTKSQKVAKELVGGKREIQLTADVAFSLAPEIPKYIALFPNSTPARTGKAVIGININGLMYNGGYTRNNMFGLRIDYKIFLKDLVTQICSECDHDIWFIPHTYAPDGNVESDPQASHDLWKQLPDELKQRVKIVSKEYDQHEIKGIISLCDFFVGSRMHSCIAALSQGVPCVGVAYSMKFSGVFESIGMGEWVIDGGNSNNDEAVARTLELFKDRNLNRNARLERVADVKETLTQIFENLALNASRNP